MRRGMNIMSEWQTPHPPLRGTFFRGPHRRNATAPRALPGLFAGAEGHRMSTELAVWLVGWPGAEPYRILPMRSVRLRSRFRLGLAAFLASVLGILSGPVSPAAADDAPAHPAQKDSPT